MSDPLRKVQRGQSLKSGLTAAAWNLLIDNLKSGAETGADDVADAIDPTNTALMVVDDDYGAFSVLGYGSPVKSPVTNAFVATRRPIFELAEADPGLPFAVTLLPAKSGRAVKVATGGVVAVLVDVSDAGHTRARPIAADATKLESCATGGVPILWKASGTGDKWAMVLLDFAESEGGSSYDATASVSGGGSWSYPSTGPVSLTSAITLTGAPTGRYRVQMSGFGSLSGTAAAAPYTIPASIDIRKTGSSTQTTGSVIFCAFQATANPVRGGGVVSGFVDGVAGDVITGRVTIDASLDATSSGTWGFTGILEAFKV